MKKLTHICSQPIGRVIPSQVKIVTPQPAYAQGDASDLAFTSYDESYGSATDQPLDPLDVQEFGARDSLRIVGNIVRTLAQRTPFTNVLAGGTIASGMSRVVRSIVQEKAILNVSLVRPTFTPDVDMCGEVGEAAEVGNKEYQYFLGTLRGMGPLVCVKHMRDDFEGSYLAAEEALKQEIVQLVNADIRITLTDRSGSKMVVGAGLSFGDMYDGFETQVDQPWPTFLPTGAVNFAILDDLQTHMRENYRLHGFEGSESEPLMRFIGSQQIITKLREEADIRTDHRYLAAGSYDIGKNSLLKYRWEGPYRGLAFGTDPQPLRYSAVDGSGQPIFIEPEIPGTTTNGRASRTNPAWMRARFEIALLLAKDSFARLTPAQYTGEGSWKFPSQVSMGELEFRVIKDNVKNWWGDYGRHAYQISRAYKPMRPHGVTAIAFKRANADYGVEAIGDYADYSSTSSLL